MTSSIRTFLLINLLLSVLLITSLAIIGNLFLAHKDIQVRLDADLIRTAHRMQALFADGVHQRNFRILQYNLNKSLNPKLVYKDSLTSPQNTKKAVIQNIEFQIWNKQGKLLLHSPNAPLTPLGKQTQGLKTVWLKNQAWRVNTVFNPSTQLTVIVAERTNYRQQLENLLTRDSIFIMIITIPFLGSLIWIIVGRGLEPLKKVAMEVKQRAPSNLAPVIAVSVPSEIEPLMSELNNLFHRLQDAFEREKRFTADAAHELKTPLAALNTQVQVALRSDTPEARKQALFKVLSGVNRSTHVVQQLLILSRMDPEANIQNPVEVVLATQAADVAAELAPEAIAKSIDLELLTPDSKASIKGNPTAIGILIRNLIDNAIRYSPENCVVQINIQQKRDAVILQVIDNGPGIPVKLRKRVLERFFRIPGTNTSGSGLGLGIVYRIVNLHNAKLELLTPENHCGLEVRITFPRND